MGFWDFSNEHPIALTVCVIVLAHTVSIVRIRKALVK